MKIGIMFANTGLLGTPEGAEALAIGAEAAGIESLWAVEHVVVPEGYESLYPYSESGKMPGGERMPLPDPLVWLTWVGAHSTRLRLATGILILPQRNPVILAKQVATLDVLTGGRTILGVGVGWLREEFEALGVPFEGRGVRADEYIGAMRALWTEGSPTYSARTVSFTNAVLEPKPPQGSVPIVVGGYTQAAARRAGRLGDGFFPPRTRNLPELLPVMRTAAKQAGRDPDGIKITTIGKPTAQAVSEAATKGVSRLLVPPPAWVPDDVGPALAQMVDQIAG